VEHVLVAKLVKERVYIINHEAQYERINVFPEISGVVPLHVKADAVAFYPSVSGAARIVLKAQVES
jgi:hypothetical protein